MKKIIYTVLGVIALAFTSACDDKLEFTPKGQTTLDNLADLELLLNQEYSVGDGTFSDICLVCNDGFPQWEHVSSLIASPQSQSYAYVKYDESIDRAALVKEDNRYNNLYKYIYYSNVVTEKADEATGDQPTRARIVAEARVKRAFFHYLLVNIYAKQYDEATADNLGGVPYVDYINMEETKPKISVGAVYARILNDCSEDVIRDLADTNGDVCRADKAFGYAVRAKVMMQMKIYDEAEKCARKAITYNKTLEDRSSMAMTYDWDLPKNSPNNYFYMYGGVPVNIAFAAMSKEVAQYMSPEHYLYKYGTVWGMPPGFYDGEEEVGVPGSLVNGIFGGYWNNYGVRTEDMFYILAETCIRDGRADEGLEFVDRVQMGRIEGYTPLKGTGLSSAEAMKEMQKAKRIEFWGTYTNFFDIKRWNSEPDYRTTITRDLGDYGTYSISPDSPLWVMPFPSNATRYNPTLTQNY